MNASLRNNETRRVNTIKEDRSSGLSGDHRVNFYLWKNIYERGNLQRESICERAPEEIQQNRYDETQ